MSVTASVPSALSLARSTAAPVAAWRVVLVGVTALLLLLGQLYVVLPVLGLVARTPGADPAVAPSVLTAFAVPYALGFLLLGPLADRLDPRTVMVASLAAASLATLGVAYAPDWGWFLLARAGQGLSAAPFTPAVLLVVAARVRPERRLVTTSAIIAAGMAAAIFAQVIAQLAASSLGLRGLFLVFAIALGAGLLLLLGLVPAGTPNSREAAPGVRGVLAAYRPIPGLVARPRILLLLIAAVSYLTVFVGLYSALQLAGPAGVAEDPTQLLLVRASAAPAMIAVPLLAPILVRFSGRRRLLTALVVGAATTGLLGVCALTGSLPVAGFAFGLLLLAAAIAVAAPATVTEVMAAAPEAGAAANALYSSAIFGGASLGAPLAAVVVGVAGASAGFGAFALVAAGLLALASILAAVATAGRPGV